MKVPIPVWMASLSAAFGRGGAGERLWRVAHGRCSWMYLLLAILLASAGLCTETRSTASPSGGFVTGRAAHPHPFALAVGRRVHLTCDHVALQSRRRESACGTEDLNLRLSGGGKEGDTDSPKEAEANLTRRVQPHPQNSTAILCSGAGVPRDAATELFDEQDEAGFRVFCGTWNVNGKAPAVPLQEWFASLSEKDDIDIFVIALQEVQDLSGAGALITDDDKGYAWSHEIQRALGAPELYKALAVRQMVAPRPLSKLSHAPPLRVVCLGCAVYRSNALVVTKVGVYLIVLARSTLAPHISEVKVAELGTGFLQQGGNKGGVAVSLSLPGGKRICVVSSHLAAQTGNVHRRNQDFREIIQRMDFNGRGEAERPMPLDHLCEEPAIAGKAHSVQRDADSRQADVGRFKFGAVRQAGSAAWGKGRVALAALQHHLPQDPHEPNAPNVVRHTSRVWDTLSGLWAGDKDASPPSAETGPWQPPLRILDHDVVFWLGDLNYRITLPDAAVLALIEDRAWELLMEFDQLHQQRLEGNVFNGFHEPQLAFVPTYKYDSWGREYAAEGEDGPLKRTPAWCDRVLFRVVPGAPLSVECLTYRRHEIMGSDHRPVSAILHVTPSRTPWLTDQDPVPRDVDTSSSCACTKTDARLLSPGLRGDEEDSKESSAQDAPVGSPPPPPQVRMLDTDLAFVFIPPPEAEETACDEAAASEKGYALVVDKASRAARWVPQNDPLVLEVMQGRRPPRERQIHGVLGVVALSHVHYLVVAEALEAAGELPAGRLFRIEESLLFPLSVGPPIDEGDDDKRATDDREYSTLKDMLVDWHLYFSPDFDATQTQQRLHAATAAAPDASEQATLARLRFTWNAHMLEALQPRAPDEEGTACGSGEVGKGILLRVVCGYAKVVAAKVRGKGVTLGLLARRSRFRAGLRFFSRGIDDDSNVSNFVETEQVVVSQGRLASHVLLRGSMPLYWQEGDALVTLKPQPTVIQGKPHEEACAAHLQALEQLYGAVAVVSLLDCEGPEAGAFAAFRDIMARAAPGIHFEAFDFHRECGKHASKRASAGMQKLLESVRPHLGDDNIFVCDIDGRTLQRQHTFLRVNCIDCLDRTNVVQASFALRHLVNQLVRLELLDSRLLEACVFAAMRGYSLPLPPLEKIVKHAWADMGDAVSLQYAGTRALKGDFTRTGKRTLQGVFKDGLANVRRAVQNNFADGFRQTVIDRVQGKTPSASRKQLMERLLLPRREDLAPDRQLPSEMMELESADEISLEGEHGEEIFQGDLNEQQGSQGESDLGLM